MTTSANFQKGLSHAAFQTAGLGAADAAVVRTWRRQAMDQKARVRVEAKREALAGFIRGLSDWLTATAA